MATSVKRKLDLSEELGRIKTEIVYEVELSNASEDMEILELFDNAESQGGDYYHGFENGFWTGRELYSRYQTARVEFICQKYLEPISKLSL